MKALSIGAVLWDIIRGEEFIGGAPFNVAVHLARLGEDAAMLTRLGRDERGRRAREMMQGLSICTDFVQWDELLPTGVARVRFSAEGDPAYDLPRSAYDAIAWDDAARARLAAFAPDCVCFGTIEQRYDANRAAIRGILQAVGARYVLFDVNIRMGFADRGVLEHGCLRANILKLNADEQKLLSALLLGRELPAEDFCRALAARYGLELILVTRGARGCDIWHDGRLETVASAPVACVDSVGAGDAFSAGFLHALVRGCAPAACARCGNALGGYVAARAGALPALDAGIVQTLERIMKG